MKRFLTNLILVVSIISILVIPSFAETVTVDPIVISKQPNDMIVLKNSEGFVDLYSSISFTGWHRVCRWQYSLDNGTTWNFFTTPTGLYHGDILHIFFNVNNFDHFLIRAAIYDLDYNYVYSRSALVDVSPANFHNFIFSNLNYFTSWIGSLVNSLIYGSLSSLLPVLCIGIGVAALLIVIKIIKASSWGI